jgi:Zn-dependent protease with chaperone function
MDKINPTDIIDVSFSHYTSDRKAVTDAHLENGIPDYAYGQDFILRQKMKAIPGLFPLFKAITSSIVPYEKQMTNLECLKVGPNQFPDIYEIAVNCARKLGIGVPTVFIKPDPTTINAYAMAWEDEMPCIMLTTAMVERFTTGELKAVIGHECGHIHNNHGIYDTAARTILNTLGVAIPGVQQVLQLASYPIKYALNTWGRAAEVTCDRAGIICCDDPRDAISVNAKFTFGATLNRSDVNIDEILKQYDAIRSTPVHLIEFVTDHPVAVRRIFAQQEFVKSEVLYKWRPEWKTPGQTLYNKQELDARCEKYIAVVKNGKRSL